MRRTFGFSNTNHLGPTGHDKHRGAKNDAQRVTSQL